MAIFTKFDTDNNQHLFADAGQTKIYRVLAVNADGSVDDITEFEKMGIPRECSNLQHFSERAGWTLGNRYDRQAFNEIALAYKQGVTWDAVRSVFDYAASGQDGAIEISPSVTYRLTLIAAGLLDCDCEEGEG